MKYSALPVFIDTKQAASLLGTSTRTVQKYIRDGVIASTKVGRLRRLHTHTMLRQYGIDEADALAVLNAC